MTSTLRRLMLVPATLALAVGGLAACTVESPNPVVVQQPTPQVITRTVDRPVYVDRPVIVDRSPSVVVTRDWVAGYYDAFGNWVPGRYR